VVSREMLARDVWHEVARHTAGQCHRCSYRPAAPQDRQRPWISADPHPARRRFRAPGAGAVIAAWRRLTCAPGSPPPSRWCSAPCSWLMRWPSIC
jgi:hypothetical protein